MSGRLLRASAYVAALLSVLIVPGVTAQAGTDGGPGGLDLATPRTFHMTTDEGTWLSVDVSPDGGTLVFALLGDLYTLASGGGRAERVTDGPAFDAMPRFSPDGRQIAFISDRSGASNLWIANADGSGERQLSHTSGYWVYYVSPVWSPDGRSILVSRNNGPANSGLSNRRPTPYDLYLFDVVTGEERRLSGAASAGGGFGGRGPADHFGATFDNDGLIWYSTAGENGQIHTLDPETDEVIPRTDRGGGAVRPILSHDGKWLVYATRRAGETALRLRDLVSGDERWLAFDVQHDQMSSWPTMDLMPGMAFTPDDSALVTTYDGKLWRLEIPSGRATAIPFTADVEQRIAASTQFQYPLDDSILQVRHIRAARLSPDGRRLAFVALDRIWIARLPAAIVPGATTVVDDARRVTSFDQSEYGPTWSPDGNTLAFVTWNDSTGGDIYEVDVDGGQPRRLSRSKAFYEKLAYTPDGTRLLFARAPRATRFEHDDVGFGGTALMWMPADGGEPTLITRLEYLERPVSSSYGVPHFGPDPDRLLLYDPVNDGLYSMRFDGTDRRLIVKADGRLWNASGVEPAHDIVLSPTGRRAAILGMQNVFISDVLPAGDTFEIELARDSSFHARRLSEVAGDFVGWSDDGRLLHYSVGASLFVHDVARSDSLARHTPGEPTSFRPARIDIVITVPKDRPTGVLALRGARIVTMRGTEVIEHGDVVVRRNRIAAVGATGTVAIPDDAVVIDVEGATILPGYVDTHAHMGALGGSVHRTEPWQYYVTLAHGVTTIRDPQTMTADVFDYADRVETGDIIGPRIFATGRGFFAGDDVASLDDARSVLRRNAEFLHSETIKLYVVGDRRHRQWYLQAAHELELSPTSEGDANFLMDLTHLIDGYAGLEHTLPTYPLYDDVVRLVAFSGATYTPVLTINYGGPTLQEYFTSRYDMRSEPKLQRFWPRSYMERRTARAQWRPDVRYAFPKFAADAANIAAAGGRVAIGSHGNLLGIGFHFEMWGFAMGGMPAHEVLRSATIRGAEALGHGADFGSVEVGKLADLQVLDRNPLADIRNTNTVRLVMKNGRLYDAATLDQVWPRKRMLSTNQWWMAAERR